MLMWIWFNVYEHVAQRFELLQQPIFHVMADAMSFFDGQLGRTSM